jgi:RNA polymerase sigma factor (TIGR02999 family)
MKPLANQQDPAAGRFYDELRRTARWLMKSERRAHTLQATGLLNEALLRMIGDPKCRDCDDPVQLRRFALREMRRVLVDWARRRKAREGRMNRLSLDWLGDRAEERGIDLSGLDEALGRLAEAEPRVAEGVTLRYFLRMKNEEVARLLRVSVKTVESDLLYGRAWLRRELTRGCGDPLEN